MNAKQSLRQNISDITLNPVLSWGITATGLALLIAIQANSQKSLELLNAAQTLAIALPVSVGTIMFSRILEDYKISTTRNIIAILTSVIFSAAQLAIFWGMFLFLSDIDISVGKLFLAATVIVFMVLVLPYKVLERQESKTLDDEHG